MGVDNLAVYESVEFAVEVFLFGVMKGTHGDLWDVFGVTQHAVEVETMNGLFQVSSPLAEGLQFISEGGSCD